MNDDFVYQIFAHNRLLEVLFRKTVNHCAPIKKITTKIFDEDKHKNAKKQVIPGQWEKFQECIEHQCNVTKGDYVLIHSSMQGLKTLGVSPNTLIDYFLDLLGSEGTLVFPTYPDLKRMEKKDGAYIYDPKRTSPWTGALPRAFISYPNAVRSKFPHNTLCAIGKEAVSMMQQDLTHGPYSQGKGSSWDYGIQHGMKILYLGVPAPTSCTVVHYAEDFLAEAWPVTDWYEEHSYWVQDKDTVIPFTTKERKQKWFDYYSMFWTGERLRKMGYLKEYDVDGVYVGIMDQIQPMSEYLITQAQKGKLLFKIPKRDMK